MYAYLHVGLLVTAHEEVVRHVGITWLGSGLGLGSAHPIPNPNRHVGVAREARRVEPRRVRVVVVGTDLVRGRGRGRGRARGRVRGRVRVRVRGAARRAAGLV